MERKPKTGIGKRISDLREDMDLTQSQLANLIGESKNTINKWEHNEVSMNADRTTRLAEILHTSCDFLLTGKGTANVGFINETGLSNATVNALRDINHCAIDHSGSGREYYENLLKTIDILVSHQDLLATLSGYFFHDFSILEILNTKGLSTIQLTNSGTFTIEDNANRFRLRIMDKLKTVRDDLIGGKEK